MKKIWLIFGVLVLVGGLVLGGTALAQTVAPSRTVSGTELKVGDPDAADSPVTRATPSSQASLSATDLGGVVVQGQAAGEIRAVQESPDEAKVKQEHKGKPEPVAGSIPVGGVLDPGVAHLYGPYWYNAGDMVTISITWTPASNTFRIGLTSQTSGIFYGCQVSGGAGVCQLRVNQAGWYYLMIWNVGPNTAMYSGFVSW